MCTGRALPVDLCSVLLLPSMTRRWSFLSQALGLMVDLDIGTENMRWMGDTRFMVGFLKGLAVNKNFKCRLKMKVVESDKVEMARIAREKAREIRGKTVIGQGIDPLVNGVRSLDMKGPAKVHGERSEDLPVFETEPIEDDQGSIPEVEPLTPDESWTTIESGGKGRAVKMKTQSEAADMGAEGGWSDGEGILYA